MSKILKQADKYVKHKQEENESHILELQRNAYADGFKDALLLYRDIKEIQDQLHKVSAYTPLKSDDYNNVCDLCRKLAPLEKKLNKYLKEL